MALPAFINRHYNPFNSLLYGQIQKKGIAVGEFSTWKVISQKADVLHVHWPEASINQSSFLKALYHGGKVLLTFWIARLKGMSLIWTAHNLQSHENKYPKLEKAFWSIFARQLDGVISLSNSNLQLVRQRHFQNRDIPAAVIRHGHFRDAYPHQVTRSEARQYLNIPDTEWRVGSIGLIRRYKGISGLMDAWRSFPASEARLFVAGRVGEPKLNGELQQYAAQDVRIEYRPGAISEEEMHYYISALDVMVLPYRAILNSGSALLALSFNVPVALPLSDSTKELQNLVGSDWVYLFEGDFSSKVLADLNTWYRERTSETTVCLSALNWDRLADETISFYLQVMRKETTVSAEMRVLPMAPKSEPRSA